ncbi:MAG: Asp-tRNA(Asn)/Glu-tRNA(Gln) amidotransferase subunit GatA [Ignavibacteria bacterium]|jgi:aspartyl-tRNA(Asn)/glutamyl-tRNA(Gln) amidotransferase subunit A|nr:Asp-tRNA(Asn)/Glu-tRNA(Gln) amidotransferase subunit GatA [Ignavibacteria bacterium]
MKPYTTFRQNVLDKKQTCVDQTQQVLNEIDKCKDDNYFLEINEDALVSAAESDKRFQNGNPRPLEGMLVGVKDNISVIGMKATCASKMLATYRPVYDATAIKRIKDAGAILLGKTNMDEFAMGSSNETSYFGGCKNPVNDEYVTGGSSGGSAGAVALGLTHTALGTDTGGSIRQPASLCGTVGFKPTYGRVSRFGLIAFASSLDQIGTLSANVDDTALLFDTMSGIDANDSTTANLPPANTYAEINQPLPTQFNVGLIPDTILKNCSEDVLNNYHQQLDKLRNMGAIFHPLEFHFIDVCVPTYIVLTTSEASSNLARLDGIKFGHRAQTHTPEEYADVVALTRGEGFGREVKRRLIMGTIILTNGDGKNYVSKARKLRSLIRKNVLEAFEQVDIIFLPTTTSTAFKCNEHTADPVAMYLSDFFTTLANLSGIPAISVPTGNAPNGLPIGMQFQAKPWNESALFRFAKQLM